VEGIVRWLAGGGGGRLPFAGGPRSKSFFKLARPAPLSRSWVRTDSEPVCSCVGTRAIIGCPTRALLTVTFATTLECNFSARGAEPIPRLSENLRDSSW
jgi:hypothetical protein